MKIEKISENSYRVRKQMNGNKYTAFFDHKPTQKEALEKILEVSSADGVKGSFEQCANSYISIKESVLSPATVKGYISILKSSIPKWFKQKNLSEINQTDIQIMISEYASNHTPKTTRNVHGFISAVLRHFRPNMVISTRLPQKVETNPYMPTEEEIKAVLEYVKDNPFYHIPFQLGVLGMRRSEICALTVDDIDGNTVHINKALVSDKNNNWVIKQTKTSAGTRDIYIPDSLAEEIKEYGKIYDGYPNTLLLGLNEVQDKLNIPRSRFHDLRHFYASYCHSLGMTDADIMASGGWKSDYTMKSIYRHEMKAAEEQKRIASSLFN